MILTYCPPVRIRQADGEDFCYPHPGLTGEPQFTYTICMNRWTTIVQAGFPSPAEEELSDVMTLDDYLIRNKEATYMVRVKGESMKDAGIMPGDLVLVERGGEARDGSIIIAEVDGNWTIKYLRKKGRQMWLEAANKSYKPIIPKESLKVVAVVRALVRRY